MKPVLLKSFVAIMAAIVTSFFVFALQGMYHAAMAAGVLTVIALFIKGLMVPAPKATSPMYFPSRSQRAKMRRLKLSKG